MNLYWNGILCAETRDEIAERMRLVLDGNYFTVVSCNSYSEESDRFIAVEVDASQVLASAITTRENGISWVTSDSVMGVSSAAKTRADAHGGSRYDWVMFDFKRDRIEIDHYAPAGFRLRWIFSVERHDREVDPVSAYPSSDPAVNDAQSRPNPADEAVAASDKSKGAPVVSAPAAGSVSSDSKRCGNCECQMGCEGVDEEEAGR